MKLFFIFANELQTKTMQMSDKSYTMKDIANELGVSVATVSRALKDSPRISVEQRERIRAFAREHNFHPNGLAESLRHSKKRPSNLIGVIVPQINHDYFSSILTGIEEQANVRGYSVIVAQSGEKYEREVRICETFLHNRVCGVIVAQAKETKIYDHFQELVNKGIPLVFYDRICTDINANRVVVDDYMGAFTAVTHLIDTGCRRIAFYGSPMTMEISKNRYNGYRDAILKRGMDADESLCYICDNRTDAEELTPKVMRRDDRPDAFFAVNDDTAIGILYTLKRMGIRVPEEVSVCGFTNGVRAVSCDPMLTTVEQRGQMVGEEAVDILVNKVEGITPMDKVEKKVVRTRLVVRGTTR